MGKAIGYGVYDVGASTGWVSVGPDHDTAEFTVATVGGVGKAAYPHATRLQINLRGWAVGPTAAAGGAWKAQLTKLAADTPGWISRSVICRLAGTSKPNLIEHRLYAHIWMNWRGRPLASHEVVVDLIAATTTRTGLRVHAELEVSKPGSRCA